jgi:hypothetical protein
LPLPCEVERLVLLNGLRGGRDDNVCSAIVSIVRRATRAKGGLLLFYDTVRFWRRRGSTIDLDVQIAAIVYWTHLSLVVVVGFFYRAATAVVATARVAWCVFFAT